MPMISPGVEVSVVNESFYTPAAPGTVPVIFVTSANNKPNASNTGIAQGTLPRNAGRPYLISSQRELAELFGDPFFYTDVNNTPVHGSELNEYGLQAAYSYLGANNRAWIVRAAVGLDQLIPSTSPPAGNPQANTYWLDTANSKWGVFVWNSDPVAIGGQRFEAVDPIVVFEDYDMAYGSADINGTDGYIPKSSIGKVGDYAIVFGSTVSRVFYRNVFGTWVLIGSNAWKAGLPTISSIVSNPVFSQASASITLNGTSVAVSSSDTVSDVAASINGAAIMGVTAHVRNNRLEIYSDGTAGVDGEIVLGGDLVALSELGFDMVDSSSTETFYCPKLHIGKHTDVPSYRNRDSMPRPSGSIWIKTTALGGGSKWNVKLWNESTQLWNDIVAPVYPSNETAIFELDRVGGGAKMAAGDVYVQYNAASDAEPLATFKVFKRDGVNQTVVVGHSIDQYGVDVGTYTITMASTDAGSPVFSTPVDIQFTTTGSATDAEVIAGAISGAGVPNVTATVTSDNQIRITHGLGGEIRIIDDATNSVINKMGFSGFVNANIGTPGLYYVSGTTGATTPIQLQASLWNATVDMNGSAVAFYIPGDIPVSSLTNNDQLWYNSIIDEVDLMVHNGNTWVGYHNYSTYDQCDPNGPIISASVPLLQSDNTALVDGDIWIDTSDIENYPVIKRYNAEMLNTSIPNRWELLDTSDQTSENGVLFGDARYNTSGSSSDRPGKITELLKSDYLDPDCPDPALYPRGMLLWNTRRSGFNVKKFVRNSIDAMEENTRYFYEPMADYYPHRWVTESGNQENGAGSFGRKAQRKVITTSLQSMVNSNEEIRDVESKVFNLMACPGYPELIGEMVNLNYDRRLSAFIVGDSPARLKPNSTSLNQWATNQNLVIEDNDDGLVSYDDYLGIYYPWGMSSDNAGNNVAIPPSHMMLKTIAYSDQVSYPWFAPAGVRRGGITNASSVGFINDEGEFQAVALNEGQRDTLYEQKVNPIAFINGAGLIAHGQKSRSRGDSAMDRINVVRLVIYLRQQLEVATRPYIYQPNDKITRDEVKNTINGILLELMGQRALSDFLVVCDETNNTSTRIDRNELWIDVAIEPIRAVEFIYIPLRIKNTGEISGFG